MIWRHFGGDSFEPSVFFVKFVRFNDKPIPDTDRDCNLWSKLCALCIHLLIRYSWQTSPVDGILHVFSCKNTSRCFSTISCWTITKIVFDLNRIVFIEVFFFLSSWALFSPVSFLKWPSFVQIILLFFTRFSCEKPFWIASLDKTWNGCFNAITCGVVNGEMYCIWHSSRVYRVW